MGELTTESVISDECWAFVEPLLPRRRRVPPPHRRNDVRGAVAAVVYVVTTGTVWHEVPDVFGVSQWTAQRRFWTLTDADVWRRLAAAAIGTPHERWARTVADAAIDRAGRRARGYPHPEPLADEPAEPAAEPAIAEPAAEPVDEPSAGPVDKPVDEPRCPGYSTGDYATVRDAMNRHDGI